MVVKGLRPHSANRANSQMYSHNTDGNYTQHFLGWQTHYASLFSLEKCILCN